MPKGLGGVDSIFSIGKQTMKNFQIALILVVLGWGLVPGWVFAGNDNLISKGEK